MDLQEYNNVALAGYADNGRRLLKELSDSGKKVIYIIERNYEALRHLEKELHIPIVGFNESNEFYNKADVIVLSGEGSANKIDDTYEECIAMAGINVKVIRYV